MGRIAPLNSNLDLCEIDNRSSPLQNVAAGFSLRWARLVKTINISQLAEHPATQ
jgi:hypothetical protein